MSLSVIEPPTFREMLALDPTWKKYVLRAPRLPGGTSTTNPFRVWGIRHDDKWAGKYTDDYASAFDVLKKMLAKPDIYADAVIVCRPVAFGPPPGMEMPRGTQWCGHCRRPSVFRRVYDHPAMRKWQVVSDDEVVRCYYCAARQQRVWFW